MYIIPRIRAKSNTKEYSKEHYYKKRRLNKPIIYKIEVGENIYIGSTIQTIKERIRGHCSHAFNDKLSNKIAHFIRNYIKEMIYWKDLLPHVTILEECNNDNRYERERFYINLYDSNLNDQLKNSLKSKEKEKIGHRKGNNHPLSKLNEDKVKEIKKLLKNGTSGKKIADEFNISTMTISNIKNDKIWKHVFI